MAILQSAIEKKLSSLLGAKVRFDKFSVSPFKGEIEATGIQIGDDVSSPVLTIARVHADVSITRALAGEIVMKSLAIEKPVLSIAGNLPKRKSKAPTPDEKKEDDRTSWRFEVEKLLLVDGRIDLKFGDYHLTADRVLTELKRFGDDYSVTLLMDGVRRRDKPIEIGTISASGRILNTADLTAIAEAGLTAELTIGELAKVRFETQRLRSRNGKVEVEGKFTLGQLLGLLPPGS